MGPKFMGITSLPRTATQGPLNVPRETIPQFQQGGGLFATAPAPIANNTPTFDLNLAPQGLSDPRQPLYIPPEENSYFSPGVQPSLGLAGALVDPATLLNKVSPSDTLASESLSGGSFNSLPMYGGSGGVGTGTGMEQAGIPTMVGRFASLGGTAPDRWDSIERANQIAFDNAMDDAGWNRDLAQSFNVLYGVGSGSGPSARGDAWRGATGDGGTALDVAYGEGVVPTGGHQERADAWENWRRKIAGLDTDVAGNPLPLGEAEYRAAQRALSNLGRQPTAEETRNWLYATYPEKFPEGYVHDPNAIIPVASPEERLQALYAAAGIEDPNAVPYVAPIDFGTGGGGAARKAGGGGIMSLRSNY
jgi:hypothetical protein